MLPSLQNQSRDIVRASTEAIFEDDRYIHLSALLRLFALGLAQSSLPN